MSEGAESPAEVGPSRFRAGRRPRAHRRRSPRYELFVVGELMNGPLHGYHLREILNRVLGPFRQMSWGALYPLVHDRERQGLIESGESDRSDPGTSDPKTSGTAPEAEPNRNGNSTRQRHSYRLTAAGREHFQRLMREPSAYTADYPELFM